MSQGEARRMTPRNRGKRRGSGKRKNLTTPGSSRNAAALYLSLNPANAAAAYGFGDQLAA
jgi:hypothetical protein